MDCTACGSIDLSKCSSNSQIPCGGSLYTCSLKDSFVGNIDGYLWCFGHKAVLGGWQ